MTKKIVIAEETETVVEDKNVATPNSSIDHDAPSAVHGDPYTQVMGSRDDRTIEGALDDLAATIRAEQEVHYSGYLAGAQQVLADIRNRVDQHKAEKEALAAKQADVAVAPVPA